MSSTSSTPIVFDQAALAAWVRACEEAVRSRTADTHTNAIMGLAALIAPSVGSEVATALAATLLSEPNTPLTATVEDPIPVDTSVSVAQTETPEVESSLDNKN